MRSFRFSIAAMMGLVVVAAIGAAVLRQGLEASAAVVFLVMGAVLCLAIVGLVCRDKTERAWWLGVSLFGWGFSRLAPWGGRPGFRSWPWWIGAPRLPTAIVLEALGRSFGYPAIGSEFDLDGEPWSSFLEMGDCLWVLAAALLGGILARALFGAGLSLSIEASPDRRPAAVPPPFWWLRPTIVLAAGFLLVTISATAGSRLASGFWAGSTCLLTWGLVGVTCAGALVCRGRQREIYLGAGLFGMGFMLVVFTRSPDTRSVTWSWDLPIEAFLESVRLVVSPVLSGAPADSSRVAAANARIFRALERHVPAPFSGVTLGDFLTYVRENARGRDGQGVPLYVHPWGMGEAEQRLDAKISVNLQDAPLKTNLNAVMEQLNLKWAVRDGLLMIAVPNEEELTVYSDPYLVVGACLLALIAIALGAISGPLVCAFPSRSAPRRH